jgi:FkbM family methyltransferase
VGRDIDFELALIQRFGLIVHAFDPTPVSLEWASREHLPDGFILHPIGLADYDGPAGFMPPRIGGALESFSMVRGGRADTVVGAPVHRLSTIMAMLGHLQVDVLKMDIEGAEYQVLPDILKGGIAPSQILVEFHHRWKEIRPTKTRWLIDLLNQHGFLVADLSPLGREYLFVRRELLNSLSPRRAHDP